MNPARKGGPLGQLVLFAAMTAVSALATLVVRAAETGAPPMQAVPPPAGTAPGTAPAAPVQPPSNTVKIVFTTVPMKKAFVYWGKRRLGMIAPHAPLVIERPRDSGPMDVIVRADGFIGVQTRAYTFADNKVAVKLTPPDQKKTLLGYREEVPAADGGVPPSAAPGGLPAGAPLSATPLAPRGGPDAGVR